MQSTRFNKAIYSLRTFLFDSFQGSWRRKSIIILSLLAGFYFTNNLITYFVYRQINSVFIVISILLMMELVVRIGSYLDNLKSNILIFSINNIRIGSTYALVLEAFKLGS